jgi:asparagine synthase (glutamine-hydrolysing)
MLSSCGRLVLTYNGEIYNYIELRLELAAAGRVFRGQSDSEVLVEACAHWGVAATLKRLNGMFAFAVWDRQTRTLYLARDRVGIKPLYWARFGGLFLFGSELKALRAHDGWAPEVDRESLRAYMRRGHVPAPYSIYRGVHKLQAGELLAYGSKDGLQISSYWDPAQVVAAAEADRLDIGGTEAIDGLDALLRDAVSRQMAADVPLGAFLSGGIDSSLVVALMQTQSSQPINTFTIGFGERRFDEAAHAQAVASHLGTNHTELRISPLDALDLVPELPRWFDEPMANRSEIPTMLVSALARRQVTVALSGDGGDELFGGYRKYYLIAAVARAIRDVPAPLRRLAADAVAGALTGVAAVHGLLPIAWRPRLSLNTVAQIAAAVRKSGDFNGIYRETRNASLAPSSILVGRGRARCAGRRFNMPMPFPTQWSGWAISTSSRCLSTAFSPRSIARAWRTASKCVCHFWTIASSNTRGDCRRPSSTAAGARTSACCAIYCIATYRADSSTARRRDSAAPSASGCAAHSGPGRTSCSMSVA